MNEISKPYDLIIVGGGPAGLTAGLYAMRAVLKSVLIERESIGGQVAITKGVENYPGFEDISGMELSEKMLNHAKSYGLEVMNDDVVSLVPDGQFHLVCLQSGKTLKGKAVILATGGNPRKLHIPGEAEFFGMGVSYCAKCDGFFFKDREVVIVGGGDTALEEALYLTRLASRVVMIHRRAEFRGSRILQQRVRAEPKITLIMNAVPEEIRGKDGEVTSIMIRDVPDGEKREIACDGVFIFIGLLPNNHLVPQEVELTSKGYVRTDDRCGTSIPGFFVAGDLKEKYAKQIVIAAAEGCTAALAAAEYVERTKTEIYAGYHEP